MLKGENTMFKRELVVLVFLGLCCLVVGGESGPHKSGENESNPPTNWGKEAAGFKAGISLPKTVYSLGEPIVLSLVVKNVSESTRRFTDSSSPEDDWNVQVVRRRGWSGPETYKKGEEVPLTLYGRSIKGLLWGYARDRSHRGYLLKPGETKACNILLNRVADMTLPGEYTIVAWRKIYGEKDVQITSGQVEVEIKSPYIHPPDVLLEILRQSSPPYRTGERALAVSRLGEFVIESIEVLENASREEADHGVRSRAMEVLERLRERIGQIKQ